VEEEKKNTQETNQPINRFLEFAKNSEPYIAINPEDYESRSDFFSNRPRARKVTAYTKEEAEEIIATGDPELLKELSNFFFYSNGFYKKLLCYYATILYYTPLLIPHMIGNKSKITEKKNAEKYFEALEFINSLNFEQLCRRFALKVLLDGAYYGIVKEVNGEYCIQDLPYSYCRSRYKSYTGVDIIELNLEWFDKMTDDDLLAVALEGFPKEIKDAYKKYKKGKRKSNWVKLPSEIGIHFELYEERPFFSPVIPAVINFNDYINLEKARDKQDLRAVIAQEIEHLADGGLVLEPDEALELHKGLKKIAEGNENLDAITTYGKIKIHQVHDTDATIKNNLEKIEKVFYSESGVSKQIFSADTNTSLEKSIQNDICTMMTLANSFSIWLKNLINAHFSNKKINFGVEILPVGQYNQKDYLSQTMNAAQYGFSFFIPSLAMGLEQNQLLDMKRLEIDLLDMQTVMVPLRSSHTESGNQADSEKQKLTEEEQRQAESEGASVDETEQAEQTIKNKNSGGQ